MCPETNSEQFLLSLSWNIGFYDSIEPVLEYKGFWFIQYKCVTFPKFQWFTIPRTKSMLEESAASYPRSVGKSEFLQQNP